MAITLAMHNPLAAYFSYDEGQHLARSSGGPMGVKLIESPASPTTAQTAYCLLFTGTWNPNWAEGAVVVRLGYEIVTDVTYTNIVWKCAFKKHSDVTDEFALDDIANYDTINTTTETTAPSAVNDGWITEIDVVYANLDGMVAGDRYCMLVWFTGGTGFTGTVNLLAVEIIEE